MDDNINNLLNSFKNTLNNQPNKESSNIDSSSININPEIIENLKKVLQNSNNTESNNSCSSNDSDNSNNFSFDINTMLKLKNIIEKMNQKDDPRSNLLYALKPYLRETRQKKIDQYANLFKILNVSDLFKKGMWLIMSIFSSSLYTHSYYNHPINKKYNYKRTVNIQNNVQTQKAQINSSEIFKSTEKSNSEKSVFEEKTYFFELLGIKLYYDDILIMFLIYFLYKENVKDDELFLSLILLLLT